MYDGNTSEILKELEKYQNKFNEGFPLMQAYGDAKIVRKQIMECIKKNKRASVLWPEIYGECNGKFI